MAKEDDYKGEDREGRVTYNKFKEAEKALKGPEYKNLLQQFMEMINPPAKKPVKGGTYPKSKKGMARKTAVKKKQESLIPASPTR
jgi:hypothetical protein